MSRGYRLRLCVIGLLAAVPIGVIYAGDYGIPYHTVDGGGSGVSDASSGGSYAMSGTIGQPDARNHPAPMMGGPYTLTGGFWVIPECRPSEPTSTATATWIRRITKSSKCAPPGRGSLRPKPTCANADFDGDTDVDQSDFSRFPKVRERGWPNRRRQRAWTESSQAPKMVDDAPLPLPTNAFKRSQLRLESPYGNACKE